MIIDVRDNGKVFYGRIAQLQIQPHTKRFLLYHSGTDYLIKFIEHSPINNSAHMWMMSVSSMIISFYSCHTSISALVTSAICLNVRFLNGIPNPAHFVKRPLYTIYDLNRIHSSKNPAKSNIMVRITFKKRIRTSASVKLSRVFLSSLQLAQVQK